MLRDFLETGCVVDGKFEILSLAGSGGMGDIYRARHLRLDRTVALKILKTKALGRANAVKRIQQEAQFASQLKHPNITQILSFGIADGRPYLSFEFLEGQTLGALLKSQRTLSISEFAAVFTQVCKGLQYAHDNSVLHRDLTPGNIFLLADTNPVAADVDASLLGASTVAAHCTVKIMDFGLAKALEMQGTDLQKLTKSGELMGTPMYMSPEQCRGEVLDAQSDIYSLGCVMYTAACGCEPVSGDNALEILFNHTYGNLSPVTLPDDYPAAIGQLISNCLARERAYRYPSVGALLSDLANVTAQPHGCVEVENLAARQSAQKTGAAAAAAQNSHSGPKKWKRIKFGIGSIVMLALSVIILCLAWFYTPGSDPLANSNSANKQANRIKELVDRLKNRDKKTDSELFEDLRADKSVAATNVVLGAYDLLKEKHAFEDMKTIKAQLLASAWRNWSQEAWQSESTFAEDDPIVTLQKLFVVLHTRDREKLLQNKQVNLLIIRANIGADLRDFAYHRLMKDAADQLMKQGMYGKEDVQAVYDFFDYFAGTGRQSDRDIGEKLLTHLLQVRPDDVQVNIDCLTRQANLRTSEGHLDAACALRAQCLSILSKGNDDQNQIANLRQVAMLKARLRQSDAPLFLAQWQERLNGLANTVTPQMLSQQEMVLSEAYSYCGLHAQAADIRRLAFAHAQCSNGIAAVNRIAGLTTQAEIAYRDCLFDDVLKSGSAGVHQYLAAKKRYGAPQMDKSCGSYYRTLCYLMECCGAHRSQKRKFEHDGLHESSSAKASIRRIVEQEVSAICLSESGPDAQIAKMYLQAGRGWLSQGYTFNCAIDEAAAALEYCHSFHYREAEKVLRMCILRPAGDRFTMLRGLELASCYASAGRYQEAAQAYEKRLGDPRWSAVLENNDEDRQCLAKQILMAADVYFQLGNSDRAQSYYERGLKTLPVEKMQQNREIFRPFIHRYMGVLRYKRLFIKATDVSDKYQQLGIIRARSDLLMPSERVQ